jgi:FtsP/CotA-like multicopper oxidase with cupredoxin domain
MTMDLNDVAYDAFLANDRTLDDPEIVRVEPGGDILLRVINGSSASNFVVDLGRLAGELVAVDGHAVRPVAGSRFPIAIAQRLDLRLRLPKDRLAHPVFAVLEGERKRTGIILAPSGARVARLGNMATKKAAPLGVKLEQNLRAAAPLAVKPADRSLRLDLTGDMAAYVWGLNGVTYGNDRPLVVARGERVEIAMTNRTMMAHPMHLHGHFFAVVAIGGKRFPGAVRDTVLVPPMTTVVIAFDADNPGRWAFHCHNLYHMEAGMMTTVRYADS